MSYDFKKFKEEKDKISSYLSGEYKSVQTGAATPQVLDLINVDAYGSKMSISHVASISIESVANLLITPYDKGLLKEIEKAINEASLGLSTASDSDGLRVFFPKPTAESREKMIKLIKEKLEDARIKVKLLREDTKKDIENKSKNSEISKDEEKRYLDELQSLVTSANDELETIFNKKEKDIRGE